MRVLINRDYINKMWVVIINKVEIDQTSRCMIMHKRWTLNIIKLAYSGIIEIKQLEPAAGRRRARLKSGRLPSVFMATISCPPCLPPHPMHNRGHRPPPPNTFLLTFFSTFFFDIFHYLKKPKTNPPLLPPPCILLLLAKNIHKAIDMYRGN